MSDHTPSPWRVVDSCEHITREGKCNSGCPRGGIWAFNPTFGHDTWIAGVMMANDDARVIVASVNALSNLSLEQIEGGAVAHLVQALKDLRDAVQFEAEHNASLAEHLEAHSQIDASMTYSLAALAPFVEVEAATAGTSEEVRP